MASKGPVKDEEGVGHEPVVTLAVCQQSLRLPAVEEIVAHSKHQVQHVQGAIRVALVRDSYPAKVRALSSWRVRHKFVNRRFQRTIACDLVIEEARFLERVLESGERREEPEHQLGIEVITRNPSGAFVGNCCAARAGS